MGVPKGKLGTYKRKQTSRGGKTSITEVRDLSRRQYANRKGARRTANKRATLDYKLKTAQLRSGVQKSGIRAGAASGVSASAIREGEETERSKTYVQNNDKIIIDQGDGGIGPKPGDAGPAPGQDEDSDFYMGP